MVEVAKPRDVEMPQITQSFSADIEVETDLPVEVVTVESGEPLLVSDEIEECCDEEMADVATYINLESEPVEGENLSYEESFILKHGDTAEAREYLELRGRFMRKEPVHIKEFVRWSELNNRFYPGSDNESEHAKILEYLDKHGEQFKDSTATYDMSVLDD